MQSRKQTPATEVERKLLADIVVEEQVSARDRKTHTPERNVEPADHPALPIDNCPLPNARIRQADFGELSRGEIGNRNSPSDDVIDLPGADTGAPSIISAILRQHAGRLVECPVKPPMCPDASLTVAADRRLVLLAVARVGLGDLRVIGQAYQWLMQNRALVAMALPQFSIDSHALPRLELIVDQADLSAEILQPMLQSGSVIVQAYRKLRWAGRTGLLLEAA